MIRTWISVGLVGAALVTAGCGSSAEPGATTDPVASATAEPEQTQSGTETQSPLENAQELVDTEQGSVTLKSHRLGVKVRSLEQIEETPLPKKARQACRQDGRSRVLGIERITVKCFDDAGLKDYFSIGLFETESDAQDQANLFGKDDVPVPNAGMPKETVCTTGPEGEAREGIVYCDLLVNRKVLLLTHSETGQSKKLMSFAVDWVRSVG